MRLPQNPPARVKSTWPLLFFLLAVALLPTQAPAADLAAVISGASNDLQKAVAELTTVRSEIEAERLPLARKLTELEQTLAERRAAFAKAQRFQEDKLVELNVLKKDAKERSDAVKYIDALLNEYARSFHSRLTFVEEPRFKALFDSLEKAAGNADLAPAEKFSQRAVLLTSALKRTEGALGGELLDGKALDKQGRLQQGKVALVGPVAMFASSEGETVGVLQQELNKADPTVVEVDRNQNAATRELTRTGKGQLVLDATLGNAFRLSALHETLFHRLAQGGLIMIPLLSLGAGAVLLALVKWFQLSRVRLATDRDLQVVLRHLEDREQAKALEYARRIPGMAGNLLATAVQHSDEKKEYIEEVLYEKMLGARTKVERGLAFLALSATTGPLLGLLGTVMGMIATFKMISSVGSGDPKQLAAGISEALICTATGMAVAIPSLLFHAFLSRKAKGIIGSMEQTAVGFVNGIPTGEDTFVRPNDRPQMSERK
ncbi:MAG TPA: MotA/TolQ/ExbB proton channel family protein [Verrucomicrobiae bacterium]|nr:MotA/TolQ/ExbB proton channel family protein [Verrucomicrobiae bacterium]